MADSMVAGGEDPDRRAPQRPAVLLQPDLVGRGLLHLRGVGVPHRKLMLGNLKELRVELRRPLLVRQPAEKSLRAHSRRGGGGSPYVMSPAAIASRHCLNFGT